MSTRNSSPPVFGVSLISTKRARFFTKFLVRSSKGKDYGGGRTSIAPIRPAFTNSRHPHKISLSPSDRVLTMGVVSQPDTAFFVPQRDRKLGAPFRHPRRFAWVVLRPKPSRKLFTPPDHVGVDSNSLSR
jgi:hypothetical protein